MKTTLIGHASLLIQSRETTVLTDPVWFDYLWEEVNVLCPSIDLQLDKVPRVDVLSISHRHQDHFDVRTLAYLAQNRDILPTEARVIAPRDDLLLEILRELDFTNITEIDSFEPIRIKDLTLTPTPSLLPEDFPEHGLLIHDGEVTVWNQVDTIVSPEIINYIHRLYGQLDFAHARFLPLLEGNFNFHKTVNLPFDEYSSFLQVVKALGPKFAVPGSAAFRYRDEYAFLNRFSFPTTQDQFLKDLADFCPEVKTSTFYPGDVAEITPEGVTIHKQASEFVRVVEDDSYKVEFKPVAEVQPIRTLTTDEDELEKEKQIVNEFIENDLIDHLEESEMMKVWKEWKVVYQLEVFGRDESQIWSIDFGSEPLEVVKGSLGKINLYEGIACSEMVRFIQKRANWDFVGIAGPYRTFSNIYRIGQGKFECFPQEKKFPQPLMEIFPSNLEMAREKFMKDVRRWKNQEVPSDPA